MTGSHRSHFLVRLGTAPYDLAKRTHIMGILNVTPDSFSDGGRFENTDTAVDHALKMIEEGADVIDVGGESTRPGSDPVTVEAELRRVIPVVERLATHTKTPVSIDTYKARVAERALDAGAVMVNDISGLTFDSAMAATVARHKAAVVLMHCKGSPRDMQTNPSYHDVVLEVREFLERQIRTAQEAGIVSILLDPGIGFGKTLEHNLSLIKGLSHLSTLGYPILVGPSRKSFIGTLLDLPVDQRLEGTAAAVAASILYGASIVRVHDVRQMKRVAVVTDALKAAS